MQSSGGFDVKLSLTAKTLTSVASGGSDVALSGRVERQVERQTVRVSGGSDYNRFGLQSTTADVSASGGSDVSVSVDGEISSSASGGSDVRYKGTARVTRASHSGGSGVHHVR